MRVQSADILGGTVSFEKLVDKIAVIDIGQGGYVRATPMIRYSATECRAG